MELYAPFAPEVQDNIESFGRALYLDLAEEWQSLLDDGWNADDLLDNALVTAVQSWKPSENKVLNLWEKLGKPAPYDFLPYPEMSDEWNTYAYKFQAVLDSFAVFLSNDIADVFYSLLERGGLLKNNKVWA